MSIPDELHARASRWAELKRWERRELGQKLRRLGLSYTEIQQIVPVHRTTLSDWCRDLELTAEQQRRLQSIRPAKWVRLELGLQRRRRNLDRIARLQQVAATEVSVLAGSPLWLAGVMLYWAEGSKTKSLCVANSDPSLIRVMMRWFREELDLSDDRFTPRLHLHTGQNEEQTKLFWSDVTGVPINQFGKTFWKREGTGHRKHVLYHGTIQIVVRRSSDLLHRVMAWIDACYHPGGPLAKLAIATDS